DDQLDADRGGEMEDDIAAIDQLGEQRLVVHRVDEVLEAGAPFQVRDIVDRSGREVVEDEDLVALLEQRIGEMGPDEAGAPGDQCTHASCPFKAAATRSTSSSRRPTCSGSERTSPQIRAATGQSAGLVV